MVSNPLAERTWPLSRMRIDQITAIMRQHLGLHRLHHIRSAEVNLLRRRPAFAIAIGFRV